MANPALAMTVGAAVLSTAVAAAWAIQEIRQIASRPDFRVAKAVPHATAVDRDEAVVAGAQVPHESALDRNEAVVPAGQVPHESALDPNESVVTVPEPPPRAAEPRREPRITITRPRLTVDQRIQAEVMERLASNASLSGRIGVETRNRVVRLSGWTTTPGQSLRAEKEARRVRGVKHVVNEIRPRIGPVTS